MFGSHALKQQGCAVLAFSSGKSSSLSENHPSCRDDDDDDDDGTELQRNLPLRKKEHYTKTCPSTVRAESAFQE